MEQLNESLQQHLTNKLHEYSISQEHKYLLQFKLYNILKSKKVFLLLNYFKLFYVPQNILQDVIGKINYVALENAITSDEYYFDNLKIIEYVEKYKNRKSDELINYYTIYKCNKCKQSKTLIGDHQSRASDEPTTVFVTCIVCNNKWRASY